MMDHIFPKSRIVGERNEKLAHAEAQSLLYCSEPCDLIKKAILILI
jgi:hypothetical protein